MKPKLLTKLKCPYCEKLIEIHANRQVIEPAVPAVVDISYTAAKSNQTALKTQ